MQLSDGEKLIINMLADLYDKLEVKGDIDAEFVRSAINKDHAWGIAWEYSGIPLDDKTPELVSEVVDILDMWSIIEFSCKELDSDNKEMFAENFPSGVLPKFIGFDGNNESKYLSATKFLVEDLKRFEEFKDRDFNSHLRKLENYRKIFKKFESIRSQSYDGKLSFEQLLHIFNLEPNQAHR